MTRRLDGKVAIVTGGGGREILGIGQAISLLFAREGCRVAVMDINREFGESTVAKIRGDGGEAALVLGNATLPADCERVVDETVAAFGGLNILVNNLGILPASVTIDQWDQVMEVNVKSQMLMAQYAAARFPDEGGAIINLSSDAALWPPHRPAAPPPARNPVSFLSAYGASKGAVISLTRQLAVHYGSRRIRANCICPGGAWTAMAARFWIGQNVSAAKFEEARRLRANATLLKTEGTAWDIANAALFLAGDESRWITGQTLVVDGGASFAKVPVDPQNVSRGDDDDSRT